LTVKLLEVVPTSQSRSLFADIGLKKKGKRKEYADTAVKTNHTAFKLVTLFPFVKNASINYHHRTTNIHTYTIVKIKGSMITARNATSYITRNNSQFKKITITTHQQDHGQALLTMRRSTFQHRTILRKLGVIPQEKIGDLQNA
jgi:hypothetical protein